MASRSRIQDSNTLEYFGFCAVKTLGKLVSIPPCMFESERYFAAHFLQSS